MAPKLEILGSLSNAISVLYVGKTKFQNRIAVNLTTTMQTVKVFVIESDGPNLETIVNFLKCFPCLGRLYIISHRNKIMKNLLRYDPLHPIECMELHLKTVVVRNYDGKRPDVNFAKFFILNAKVLREMEFAVRNNCNQKWLANQHRRLQLENKASQGARFIFKTTWGCDSIWSHQTHELSQSDPFGNSLRC